MFISKGDLVKKVTLYPHTNFVTELQNFLWFDDEASDRDILQLVFAIYQVMSLKESS